MSDFYIDGSYIETKLSCGIAIINSNNTVAHTKKYEVKIEHKKTWCNSI